LERFLLNALKQEKSKYGLKLDDAFENATWENVKNVLNILKKQTIDDSLSTIKRDYIKYEVLPLVEIYCRALQSSGFEPSCLFDKDFSIDTGIICNLGKGLNYFKGITKKFNEPLTPIHERNYGIYCSTMKQEDTAWRLSAGPNDTLIIEELQLKNTATIKGQVSVKKIITDVKVEKEIDLKYLVPGEI